MTMSQTISRIRGFLMTWIALAGAVSAPAACGAEPEGPIDYERQVKPILSEHCYACHGPLAQKSGLRLDTAKFILKGSDGGEIVEPGKGETSLLIERVTDPDGSFRMPPEADGAPLSAEKIAILKAWIDQGAKGPAEEAILDPRDHWSYKRPVKAPLPGDASARDVNPIDAFLSAARESRGLTPVSRADKETLLRRAYLDLIGLPPTREEIRAFLADSSPDAYERMIDRLLASPHYGERWARHWMDVWRYTDWFGLGGEVRYSQKHIWRWRDWIVDSLHEDKGYDRMILEMLAADELAPADPNVLPATGFLTRNWYLFNRNYWLDDVITHTSKGLLGITFNCARCHDHKYDPISQKDYYRLRAFFEPHKVRHDPVEGKLDVKDDGLSRVYDAELDTPTYLFVRGEEKQPDTDHPLESDVPAVLADLPFEVARIDLPLEAYYPGFAPAARRKVVEIAEAAIKTARGEMQSAERELAALREKRETLVAKATAPAIGPPTESAADDQSAFIADDFSKPRPDFWEMASGQWQYDSCLKQTSLGPKQSRLITRQNHPRDFLATMRFKIVDGGTRSVGMIFDVSDDSLCGVYVSPSGPKSQLYHVVGGREIYPGEARRELPIENDREYELKVAIRDQLANVWLNGEFQFAYRMTQERRDGRFALTAYDAATEFLGVRVSPLSTEAVLATTAPDLDAETAAARGALDGRIARAELGLKLTQKRLAQAAAELPAVQARLAAETAKYLTKAENHEELAFAAGQAERQAKLCQKETELAAARAALFDAEQALAAKEEKKKGQKDPEASVKEARTKVEQAEKQVADARQALESPGREYSTFGPVYPSVSSGRRLGLARWIANRDNPLTARVAVNHIWARHFDEPLVASMFDFGLRTPAPLHQDLLDWLAVDFMESGWSMKRLHRLIVTSETYRMRSGTRLDDPNLELDPDNRYLWRMNPRRMEAEIIRDSLLALAGKLNLEMGGPDAPVETADKTFRRTIYYRYARHDQIKFLTMFDPPSVEECYRRPSSVVPQQALAMQNSKLSLDSARSLAEVLAREVGEEDSAQGTAAFLESAFERVLGRAPTPAEAELCASHLKEFVDAAPADAEGSPLRRARENLIHVLLNHNEFVTIR